LPATIKTILLAGVMPASRPAITIRRPTGRRTIRTHNTTEQGNPGTADLPDR